MREDTVDITVVETDDGTVTTMEDDQGNTITYIDATTE
jgi:hypothetical protein